MTAKFERDGPNRVVLVVKPDHGTEALLMATFLRFDQNVFSVYVERHDDGQIERVLFRAGEAA